MSEIIEVLAPALADCPTFTVNTAAKYVSVAAGALAFYTTGDSTAEVKFNSSDSFSILSIGLALPESFILAEKAGGTGVRPLVQIFLELLGESTRYYAMSTGSGNSYITLPFENFENVLSRFYDTNNIFSVTGSPKKKLSSELWFKIRGFVDNFRVSMLNVPAALNGDTFHVVPWIKVQHNFPLTI